MNIYLFFTFLFLFSLNINFLVHSVCIKHCNMHKKMCNLTTWFHNKNAWRKKMHHQTLMRLHMLCAVCQRKIFFWSSNLCTVIAFYKLIIAMFYILLICPILTDLLFLLFSFFCVHHKTAIYLTVSPLFIIFFVWVLTCLHISVLYTSTQCKSGLCTGISYISSTLSHIRIF